MNTKSSQIAALKDETKNLEKNPHDEAFQLDEIAQYIRRDCLEVTGVKASENCTADAIVKSVGKLIGVSIAHLIPAYSEAAAPKLIVKFTRRNVRNKVYSSRRKLVKEKAKDLPNLGLAFEDELFISESLTQTRKKLFGEVNKVKNSSNGSLSGRLTAGSSFGRPTANKLILSIVQRIWQNSKSSFK